VTILVESSLRKWSKQRPTLVCHDMLEICRAIYFDDETKSRTKVINFGKRHLNFGSESIFKSRFISCHFKDSSENLSNILARAIAPSSLPLYTSSYQFNCVNNKPLSIPLLHNKTTYPDPLVYLGPLLPLSRKYPQLGTNYHKREFIKNILKLTFHSKAFKYF
jgi:hypothetical protein